MGIRNKNNPSHFKKIKPKSKSKKRRRRKRKRRRSGTKDQGKQIKSDQGQTRAVIRPVPDERGHADVSQLSPWPFFLCPINHMFSSLQGFCPMLHKRGHPGNRTVSWCIDRAFKMTGDFVHTNAHHRPPLQKQEVESKASSQMKPPMSPQASDALQTFFQAHLAFVLCHPGLSHLPYSTTSLWKPVETVQARKARVLLTLGVASLSSPLAAAGPKPASEISVPAAILRLDGRAGKPLSHPGFSLCLVSVLSACLCLTFPPTFKENEEPSPLTKGTLSLVCLTFLRRANGEGSGRASHAPSSFSLHPPRCEDLLVKEGVAVTPASHCGQLWGGSCRNPTLLRQLIL